MMDFLRRLAPPNPRDASRAVAVLPTRFASESPLRSSALSSGAIDSVDDDRAAIPMEDREVHAPIRNMAGPNPAGLRAPSEPVAPRTQATRPQGEVSATPAQQTTSLRRHAETNDVDARGNDRPQQKNSDSTTADRNDHGDRIVPAPSRKAAALPVTTTARQTAALPLSPAVLAQRANPSRDEDYVVHVTIGRIDVIANTAPAPSARSSLPPRQASVTLADYLRPHKGGRQ